MGLTELTIQQLGPKGDGIHFGARGRVYIEGGVPGDYVTARVRRDAEGLARGEIVEIIDPSPQRQKAPCIHYDRCGGCTLQHVTPEFYRYWKGETVKDALFKQGLRPRHWRAPVFLGDHNRRRVTFTAIRQRGKIVMGYYRRRSQQVTDVESCLIADPSLLELRNTIKPFLRGLLVDDGKPTDIFLQKVDDMVDMVITGPVGEKGKPDRRVCDVLTRLLDVSPVARISWRADEKDKITPLLGKRQVVAAFGPLIVKLPPAAFMQPTREGERVLVNAVLAALPQHGKFADLFSGCGTFSGPMLERGSVDAWESVPRMVQALARAAGELPLTVFQRDLARNPLRRDEVNRYDAVVFDPPRGGCPEQALAMASSRVRTLVGVSCNPATFARDARILCGGGYELQSLQVVDQFLWSHHVEMVGVFTKMKRKSK